MLKSTEKPQKKEGTYSSTGMCMLSSFPTHLSDVVKFKFKFKFTFPERRLHRHVTNSALTHDEVNGWKHDQREVFSGLVFKSVGVRAIV